MGEQFWRQERELVLDVFSSPGPIGCPDRPGCVCRPGRYPVEVSVWEMPVMELLGRSLSPDVSQTDREAVRGLGLGSRCSDAGGAEEDPAKDTEKERPGLTAGGTHSQHFGGSVPCQVSRSHRRLVC